MSLHGNDWAFSAAPGRHRGQVNAIVQKGDLILSAGEDGFLEIWNPAGFAGGAVSGGQAGERFQLSPYSIISLAGRPGKDEVCIVENDGMGLYHVSAWDFTMRRKIFTLQFRDPIGHISYSTGGNFIVAARAGRTGIVLIDSASGDVLRSPQALTGTVGLAVTGRSERNMMVYLASGAISYWDLETGTENNRFDAPANLSSPVLFGNSRYLAGVNSQGLTVIHAASGEILAANSFIPGDSLLSSSGDGFICLVQREESADLYRYTVDRGGRLVMLGYFTLSAAGMDRGDRFTAICAVDAGRSNGPAALGISNGSLAFAGLNGQTRLFTTQDQALITEAAVSDRTIAFLSGDGRTGFIPADYNMFSAGRRIDIERNEKSFNRITAFAPEHGGGGQFVFWQDQNTRTAPVIRSTNPEGDMLELSGVSFRSPVHSAGSFGGKIVFMDTTGNLSVVSPADEGKSRPFTYFSIGLMDAAFVDRDRLVIGRSAVSG
ncbi:MAG: WD40 repeat domain-containing protein, partial [Treponema sp.]|nr:WD40 repeat domain-containing protein [Treponema sp.]